MKKSTVTLEQAKKLIKFYPDWPKAGINFIDMLPILSNADTFSAIIGELSKIITTPNIAAPEARGFLFSAPLLVTDSTVRNLITFRKNGKLPAAVDDLQKVSIVKEYGDDSLFFRISDIENAQVTDGAIEITVFDDILATGGTAEGMATHLNSLTVSKNGRKYPVKVKEFVFLAEISALKGANRLAPIAPVTSLILF